MTTFSLKNLLRVLGGLAQGVIVVPAWLASLGLCAMAFPRWAPLSAFALTVALTAVAVWLHEGGHYLGARLAGMRVLRICATFADIVPQRRGFRWRRRRDRRLAGMVIAVPAPDRTLRSSFLVFTAGGPVANLLAAALGAAVAWPLRASPEFAVVLAFALTNAAIGLANLVPSNTSHVSDGLQLLAWMRRRDERSCDFAATRVLSLTVFGTPADELPSDDLAAMERQPSPAPLQALWFRTKAAQNRADWDATPALIEAAEAQIEALEPAARMPLRPFVYCLRAELAFSEAMRLRDETPLREVLVPSDVDWLAPVLRPRIAALRAALHGDAAGCERALGEAYRHAENEVDASSAPSEARIATALRERCGLADASGGVRASMAATGRGRVDDFATAADTAV